MTSCWCLDLPSSKSKWHGRKTYVFSVCGTSIRLIRMWNFQGIEKRCVDVNNCTTSLEIDSFLIGVPRRLSMRWKKLESSKVQLVRLWTFLTLYLNNWTSIPQKQGDVSKILPRASKKANDPCPNTVTTELWNIIPELADADKRTDRPSSPSLRYIFYWQQNKSSRSLNIAKWR